MTQIKDNLTRGLPAVYFNDDDYYQQVKEKIYFKTWQLTCHSSQVSHAGDFFSFALFDQDIVVVRDQTGQLRALYNVCQHRGHKLVSGQGNKASITCPYHTWTYQLDGRLLSAPNSQSIDGFNSADICIPSIRVEEFLGFVFVNLDDHCASMDECYPGVKDAIVDLCPDIEMRAFAHMHQADEGCNWMTAVENYNECYHCKVVHADFSKGVIDPQSYNIVPFGKGKVLHHSSKPSSSEQSWYDVSGSDYGSFYLWPATSIQIYPSGVVNSYHWRPLAVDDVRVYRGWYSDDGEVDETLQKVIDMDRDTTFAEDLVLVKNVHRGLQSKGYRPGPLIIDPKGGINNELSISYLHQWLIESLS